MNTRQNELKSNDLAKWLETNFAKVQPFLPVAIGVVAVVLVGGILWSTFSGGQNARAGRAWSTLFDGMTDESALERVPEDYPGSQAAAWALHAQATSNLMTASAELFTDRDAAEKNLNSAISGFKEAIKIAGNDKLLLARAHFGLAQAQEAAFDLEEARAHYEESLKVDPDGPLAEMAQRQLELLNQTDVKQFYGWFKDQSPEPPAPPTGLTPPTEPLSPLGDLPDLSDLPDLGPMPETTPPTESAPENTPPDSSTPDPTPSDPAPSPDSTPPDSTPSETPPAGDGEPAKSDQGGSTPEPAEETRQGG